MADAQMSFATITGAFLKRYYGKGSKAIKNTQNLKARFYDSLGKSQESPKGDGFYFPVNVEGNESGRASNEDETFDNAQSETDVQFVIRPKTTFWPFQLTGLSMDVAESNEDSFARSLKRQMNGNQSRMFSDLNRQCWGAATGEMTKVNGAIAAPTTSIVVDSVQYFRKNMRIDIWSAVGGSKTYGNLRITGIDKATLTITVDTSVGATTIADNSVICKKGVLDNAPSDYKELFGATAIVDTTTYNTNIQGQSKSTYPTLQATVIDAAGASITNALLQQCETSVEDACEMDIIETWSDREQRDNYIELLTPLKRFVNDDAMDSGKRKDVEHNGNPWKVDKDSPAKTIFKFTKGYIQKFVLKEPDIVDRDGSTIRALPNSDIYQGYYKSVMNLGSEMPNAGGKIINLA